MQISETGGGGFRDIPSNRPPEGKEPKQLKLPLPILSNLRTKPHSARFSVKIRAGKCCYKTMGCALTNVKKQHGEYWLNFIE